MVCKVKFSLPLTILLTRWVGTLSCSANHFWFLLCLRKLVSTCNAISKERLSQSLFACRHCASLSHGEVLLPTRSSIFLLMSCFLLFSRYLSPRCLRWSWSGSGICNGHPLQPMLRVVSMASTCCRTRSRAAASLSACPCCGSPPVWPCGVLPFRSRDERPVSCTEGQWACLCCQVSEPASRAETSARCRVGVLSWCSCPVRFCPKIGVSFE
jgi:hypothetical protein